VIELVSSGEIFMKTRYGWALASAMLLGSMGSAYAADMAVKAPPMPVAAVASWTGFYVGLNGGYARIQDGIDVNPTLPFGNTGLVGGAAFSTASTLAYTNRSGSRDAGFAGGQVGYNWQVSPRWVLGLEADVQGFWNNNNQTIFASSIAPPGFPANPLSSVETLNDRMDWLATFRGRAGILLSPSFLLYGTGGLAVGEVNASTTIVQQVLGPSAVPNAYSSLGSVSETRAGWVAGAGAEWLVRTWSFKVEGLYYDLGSRTFAGTPLQNFNTAGTLFTSSVPVSHVNFNGVLIRAGINWHFAGPVVAKY
jgi:outer membrane immunogenic protein